MTSAYDAALAADRYITDRGAGTSDTHYNANANQPYDKMPSTQREPATLRPPSAGGIGIHSANATTSQRAWAEAQNAANKLDEYVDSLIPLIGDPRYTSDNIREHVAAFANTDAAHRVEDSLEAVRRMAEDAEAAVASTRERLMSPGDSAAELRNTRYWNRVQRTLDSTKDGHAGVVEGLIKDAKADEIGVLLQELPSYMQTKGFRDLDWIDQLVGQKVPEYGTAQRRAAVAQSARTIAERNAKMLQTRYATAYPHPTGTPGKPTSYPMIFPDAQYDPELI